MMPLNIEAADIKYAIIAGLKKAWKNHFIMTDERDEDITPEYLTTAAICYELSDFVGNQHLNGRVAIRAEEQTRTLWAKAQMLSIRSWGIVEQRHRVFSVYVLPARQGKLADERGREILRGKEGPF